MPKFFIQPECIQDDKIVIQGENVNHIKNVLRLNVGDEILINDRQGKDYECIINALENHQVIAHIQNVLSNEAEPTTQTILFQSLIKGEKMEWVIQKAVEIGVTEIVPLCTTRCVVKMDTAKKTQSKIDRWAKIAESAAKQSGRGIIPKVHMPMQFKDAMQYIHEQQGVAIIPYEKESATSIRKVLEQTKATTYGVFIGPEGGFTEEEVTMALENNVQAVTLGKRILRSETASLVTLANIMYEMGEME